MARRYPFTIRLVDRRVGDSVLQSVKIKLDPGSLACACVPCNEEKGARPVEEFLAGRPKVLARVKAHAKRPLKDAAAVNATRWALFEALKATGLPVECGSGGRTKWNRSRLGIPKTHALDAACVGAVDALADWAVPSLSIKAMGGGSYQRTRLDAHGFPRGYLTRRKRIRGFQTGDMVRATVSSGKKAGVHVGRVAVRATGSFNIQTPTGVVQGVNAKRCIVLSRADGYSYTQQKGGVSSSTKPSAVFGVSTPQKMNEQRRRTVF